MRTPLPFAPPRLADAPAVRRATAKARQSDLAFANIYLLRHKYHTEIALEGGFLFRHFEGNTRLRGYAFPCGKGDIAAAIRRIEEDATLRERPFAFCLLTDEDCATLERLYPARFRFETDPGDADYLYTRQDLVELPGARFHRKRNHLARFEREFPDWEYAPLTPQNAPDALAVADAWLADAEQQAEPAPGLRHEREAIAQALEHASELELMGGLIYVGGQPAAMALASLISPEVADVHYEKCHPAYRAAYPLINRELAKRLPCPFVNREEDLNQAGLRQAKMSYFPALILSKSTAVPALC